MTLKLQSRFKFERLSVQIKNTYADTSKRHSYGVEHIVCVTELRGRWKRVHGTLWHKISRLVVHGERETCLLKNGPYPVIEGRRGETLVMVLGSDWQSR